MPRKSTALWLALLALGALAAFAQRVNRPEFPFGMLFAPEVYGVERQIDVILNFSDEQKAKLSQAYTETLGAPALQELRTQGRANPAVGEQLRLETTKAETEFKKRAGVILTAEQTALIKKVDEAVKNVLNGVLTPEQKDLLAKAKAARSAR